MICIVVKVQSVFGFVEMDHEVKILSVEPELAIPGGEVTVKCEGLRPHPEFGFRCAFNGVRARTVGASCERIVATVPEGLGTVDVEVQVEGADGPSGPVPMKVARKWAEDLHIVANPAVDPRDGSVIVTRSGSRGQKLPVTLFRVRGPHDIEEIRVEFLNPTGIAFDASGKMFVTGRAEGFVAEVTALGEVIPYATDLGVPTGIAFDDHNRLFVGDRSGNIYSITDYGAGEIFATLEPSVSAYHMAFGPDGMIYMTSPGLASFDSIHAVDGAGFVKRHFKGLGRPQGLAFDLAGNLYVAACYQGRRGIVKIQEDGLACEHFVAGRNVIGLCFGADGEMFIGTNDALYCLPLGVQGMLIK